jgi:SAM-dependent methyltransferase
VTDDPTTNAAFQQQMDYYSRTAVAYDSLHISDNEPEHDLALEWISLLLPALGIERLLDTGCGTGRGIAFMLEHHPNVAVRGNDPSAELLQVARDRRGVPGELLDCSVSSPLPYADGSFDAVMALGILHHVPDPSFVVREMLRVAKRAVFISDNNRFGQGRFPWRLAKWTLWKAGLWQTVFRRANHGQDWFYSEGDGVAYSYSVFDSLPLLERNSHRQIVIPTTGGPFASAAPVLLATHAFVCAIK